MSEDPVRVKCSIMSSFWRKYIILYIRTVQVNICQKHLFLHQLTHNMTTDSSLNYVFGTWKFIWNYCDEYLRLWRLVSSRVTFDCLWLLIFESSEKFMAKSLSIYLPWKATKSKSFQVFKLKGIKITLVFALKLTLIFHYICFIYLLLWCLWNRTRFRSQNVQ